MALPRLNDTPKYEINIPSTGVKVKFRPYLVKEEKILLLAMESQDQSQALSAIADTVVACIHDKIDKSKLTTFDIEYLFLKIRSKSVGEKSTVSAKCKECGHPNQVTLDLDTVQMVVPKVNPNIKLTDKISMKMKFPPYDAVTTSKLVLSAKTPTEQAFAVVAQCIESIQTETENFSAKDTDEGELIEFLESMTSDQYKKLIEFVSEIPKLSHEIKVVCEKCFAPNVIVLEGINDFF